MSYVFGILIILFVLGYSIIFFGGIAWEIVELIIDAIKNKKLRKVDKLKKLYPEAYEEWYGKDWTLYKQSFKVINQRLSHSKQEWELKQQECIKEKEREFEIKKQYIEIENKYPNGLRLFRANHPDLSTIDIISTPHIAFKELEESHNIFQYYSKWRDAQTTFAETVRYLRDTVLGDWGCYDYCSPIQGINEWGQPCFFDFVVWQFFIMSFGSSQTAGYSSYPYLKANYEQIPELINKKRFFNTCVYDQIISFIESVPGNPIISFADSGLSEIWKSLEDYHFGYLKRELIKRNITFVSEDHLPPSRDLHSGPVFFIELISNNERLMKKSKHFLELSSGNNITIAWISLFKEYDNEEINQLNLKKEKGLQDIREKELLDLEGRKRREEEKWFNGNCGWLESEIVTPGIIEQQELLCQLSQEKMIYPEAEEFGNAPSGNLCQ